MVRIARDTNADGDYDDGTDAVIATYCYDGDYRRIRKHLPGDANYDYDYNEGLGLRSLGEAGWQCLEERKDDDPDPYVQYVWDLRYIDSVVYRFRDPDTDDQNVETVYYLNDVNFNVTALADATNSQSPILEVYVYDPYGKPATTGPASSYGNEILYCGYRYDPESGLYHVRMRPYNPLLGRWNVPEHWLGYRDSMNLQEVVGSNPCRRTDPGGLSATERAAWMAYAAWISTWNTWSSGNKDFGYHHETYQMLHRLTQLDQWNEDAWNAGSRWNNDENYRRNVQEEHDLRERFRRENRAPTMPMSGAEPAYAPVTWNAPGTLTSNNCYSYA